MTPWRTFLVSLRANLRESAGDRPLVFLWFVEIGCILFVAAGATIGLLNPNGIFVGRGIAWRGWVLGLVSVLFFGLGAVVFNVFLREKLRLRRAKRVSDKS